MSRGPLKILIVEDNPADRALCRVYLKQVPGIEIAEAGLGSTGLDLCRSWMPDCVLLDFTLPDLTGLEFINQLRADSPIMPCALVMLTGIADERVAVRAVKAGATDYIPKSENMEAILEHSIFNAIAKHRLEEELVAKRRELARSEHQYRSLMDALPQLVWTADAPSRISFGNRQWWQYVGISGEQPRSFEWESVLHPDDRERWWRHWSASADSLSAFDIEIRLWRQADRQYRWHLIRSVRPAADAEWLVTCTDIEDQKRAEQSLLQRQKWDSIGLLAGGIAHDFNNLLVGILGGASYVSDLLPSSHQAQPMLQNIVSSGERAAHLTRQLLAYAGKGSFLIQEIDLSAVVQQTCELVRSSVPNNVQLRVQTTPGLPRIESDSGQIEQVVMNLILNALEAIPQGQGGVVFVRTFLDTTGQEKSGVLLEVRDTGSGMDAETQSRIFDPFFTTKFAGRGLGLAAVHGILRSSGASIDVTSSPGNGSTFRVRFRAVADRLATLPAPENAGRNALKTAHPGVTVLVVDDEPSVRQMCRLALERAGFTVLLAPDGPRGLQCLEEKGSEIGLILLDLGMPGMTGQQVLLKIRASGRSVPVIVFSGYSEIEVAHEFEGLDVASFLQKPFVAGRLTTVVAEVVNSASFSNPFRVASAL